MRCRGCIAGITSDYVASQILPIEKNVFKPGPEHTHDSPAKVTENTDPSTAFFYGMVIVILQR